MASVKITFIGHASFRFESDKGSVTYFDAWLDSNPTAKMKLSQVKAADIVIASHGHSDHIGDSYEICKHTKAKFVGNYELCSVAETVHGLKMGSRALSMNPGGAVKVKDATITMVQGHHSQSLSTHVIGAELPAGLLFHPDSAVNGFVVAYNNGISIYDTADTCLFSDMQLIGQMYGPQIAIMPVGGQLHNGDPRGGAGGEPNPPRHRHSLPLRADYESASRHRRIERSGKIPLAEYTGGGDAAWADVDLYGE